MSSKSIDKRVVDMQFNNKQFEAGAKTSLRTLDKLKSGLDFKKSTKSLSGLSDAAKKFSLAGMAENVNAIAGRFSNLGIVGMTALTNITNSAVNAGKRIVSALTIDPITTGLQEYETQINAVQTILANTSSKGTTLNQVNAALDELNTYADKTIYNFTEMTRNIGTFTAAGVDLDTSVSAIKGIANLAAVSGSTSQQASVAMYQLSQALSSGTVKLMDWNSVVNAGMGGQVFQDSLKETARLHGIAIDDMIDTQGSFRETLQKGWLSADILTETLSKFTGDLNAAQLKTLGYTEDQITEITKLGTMANDAATKVKTFTQLFDTLKEAAQSGWSQSWKIIIGDFGEAKLLLTEMSDTVGNLIGDSAQARNDLLSGGLSTGWKQFLNAGVEDEAGYIDALTEVAKTHGVALDTMITKEGSFADTLKSGWLSADMMSEALKNLTAKTQGLSDDQLTELGYTRAQIDALEDFNKQVQNGSTSLEEFATQMTLASGRENLIQALRNSFDGLMDVLKPIKEGFREIFPATTGDQLYAFTKKVRDFTAQFKLTDTQSKNIKRTFKGLFAILNIGKKAFTSIAKIIGKLVGVLAPAGEGLLGFSASIGDWLVSVDNFLDKSGFFTTAFEILSDVIIACTTGVTAGVTAITKAFGKLLGLDTSSFSDFSDTVKEKFKPLAGVAEFIGKIGIAIGTAFKKIVEYLKPFGQTIGDSLKNLNFAGLAGLFSTGTLGMLVLGIKKFIDTGSGFLYTITDLLDGVRGCLEAYQNNLRANILLKIAAAIGILAASFLVLSMVDPDKIAGSLAAMTTLFAELMGSMVIFDKAGTSLKGAAKLTLLAIAMILISTALLILAGALKKISSCDWGELTRGVIGIGALTAMLVIAAKAMEKSSVKLIAGSVGLILFATAIVILAQAVKTLGELDPLSLIQGLIAVAAIMAGIAVFVKNMGNSGKLIATSIAIGILAIALNLFAVAISSLGSMPIEQLVQGLGALAATLALIICAVQLMPKNLAGMGIGLIGLAVALMAIAVALKIMGSMSFEQIAAGLITLGGALLIIIVAVKAMQGAIGGAAAMLVVGAALLILAVALKILGSMSLADIGLALLALVGALVIFGGAAALLTPVIPSMLLLGAALIVLGVGLIAIGAAALVLAMGLGALAVSGISGVAILVAITLAVTPLTLLAPAILVVGAALLVLSLGVAALGVSFMLLGMGLGLIVATGPAGLEALVALAETAVQISNFALEIVAAGIALTAFGAGAVIAGAGAVVAGAGVAALGAGLMVLSEVDLENLVGFSDMSTDLLKASAKLLLASPGLVAGGAGLLALGEGAIIASTGFENLSTDALYLGDAFKTLLRTIKKDTSDITTSISDMLDAIVQTIQDGKPVIVTTVTSMTTDAISAINNRKSSFKSSGMNLVNGFIVGINSKVTAAANAAAAMAHAALAAANREIGVSSPATEFIKTGMYADLGLAEGLTKYAKVASVAATNVAKSTIQPVINMTKGVSSNSLATVKELQNMTIGTKNTTPIVRTERSTTVHHTFDNVTVRGVNDKDELVAVADYAVEDMLTSLMRRDSRR